MGGNSCKGEKRKRNRMKGYIRWRERKKKERKRKRMGVVEEKREKSGRRTVKWEFTS